MHRTTRTLLVTTLSLTLVGLPVLTVAETPVPGVDQHTVALAWAADGGGAWISGELTDDLTVTGLTWDDPGDAPDAAEVRVQVDGSWGAWEAVELDDEHSPDPGTSEATRARGGTAPIVVAGADAVQFRVTDATVPTDLTAELVSVDRPGRMLRLPADRADAATERPAIHPRSDWGGDTCVNPDRDPLEYVDRVQVLFVHHTTGFTSYEPADVPGIVRSICSYHINGRGWDDIGYNALIDRFGGIWEGRAGGLELGVRGAHTGGFNAYSTGVALIGDHSDTAPTEAARDALIRYGTWMLGLHHIDPLGRSTVVSNGSSRWPDGDVVEFLNVSGHRDASFTACPGGACYAGLPSVRAAIDELGGYRSFGGWPQSPRISLREDERWPVVRTTFSFTDDSDWSLEVRDDAGRLVHSDAGAGTEGTSYWDATVDGHTARKGAYTSTLRAVRRSDGTAAEDAVAVWALGGPLGEFDDVDHHNVFEGDIAWLAGARITYGCNPPLNTRFCPDGTVTRGQMAAFLSRALGLEDGRTGTFTDVPDGHLFAREIAALAAADITRGCNPPENTRFCPDAPVSREQMAAFLTRSLGLGASSHPGFSDVEPGSNFDDDIRRLATADVTRGCNPPDNTRYCPTRLVTRAQMAAFLHRALDQ